MAITRPSLGRTMLTYLIAGPPAVGVALVACMAPLDAVSGFPQSRHADYVCCEPRETSLVVIGESPLDHDAIEASLAEGARGGVAHAMA